MAPTRIPEGFAFVPGRSHENAKALLEAAEKAGGDRVTDVRTVTGGYHVSAAVAKEFQKAFPDAAVEEGDELVSDDPNGEPVELQGEPTPEPLGVTEKSSHDEIDDYASKLEPPVTFPKDTNKADKIKLLEEARKPQNPAE